MERALRLRIVPVENSVSSQMPLNESELKAQTPQGFPGNEEIQDTAASNLAIDGLKREGNGALLPPDNHGLPLDSGCASVVAVMETTHLRDSHDSSLFRWLDCTRLR